MICPKCGKTSSCDKPSCPLKSRELFAKSSKFSFKKDFFGTTPNVFVGHYGYPNINVGLLSTDYSDEAIDNPLKWSKENYDMNKIVNLRTTLVNSKFASNIRSPTFSKKSTLDNISKEISLAPRKVDTEIHLKRAPSLSLNTNHEATPHGPSVPVKSAEITENVKIPTKIDKVVSDDEFKASSALRELYKKHFDEHYLTKILSMGNLGMANQRKLVPTRWSITAVDDTLGKNLLKEISDYSNSLGPISFFGGHLENYFLILFFPGKWSFDFIENYSFDMDSTNPANNIKFDMDSEGYHGRKEYAHNTAGAYYASKLAVLEYLKKNKRQSSVIILRFTTTDYYASLGVWVVRETLRKVLNDKPLEFGSEDLMIKYGKKLIFKKFNYDISIILSISKILDSRKHQRSLIDF